MAESRGLDSRDPLLGGTGGRGLVREIEGLMIQVKENNLLPLLRRCLPLLLYLRHRLTEV